MCAKEDMIHVDTDFFSHICTTIHFLKEKRMTFVKQAAASGCSPGLKRTGKQAAESRLCFCCQASVWIRGL